jgi:ppGpp synthetase/RelA/SpoT-type nucleotidyltranferase
MPLTNDMIDGVVNRFEREADRYAKLAAVVAEACRALVRDNAIPATVQWRAKEPDRLRAKLTKNRNDFNAIDEAFSGLKDFAGARVLTYADSDRPRVVEAIRQRFTGPTDGEEVRVEVLELPAPSFYRATHCQVWLRSDDLLPSNSNLKDASCEIQVCSLLAHVWNEIEHDLVYKVLTGQPSDDELQLLQTLGHNVRGGDLQVSQLVAATKNRLAQLGGVFRNQWDFVARIQQLFPEANDLGTHSGQLFDELVASGFNTPELISQLIGDNPHQKSIALIAAINGYLDDRQEEGMRFEPGTSDELGVLYLLQRADEVIARHPGQGRPLRIASLARRVKTSLPDLGI